MPLFIFALEVAQQAAAIAHHFQKSAARVVVFLVMPQMLGNLLDFRGQNRNLHLWRASVRFVGLEFFD